MLRSGFLRVRRWRRRFSRCMDVSPINFSIPMVRRRLRELRAIAGRLPTGSSLSRLNRSSDPPAGDVTDSSNFYFYSDSSNPLILGYKERGKQGATQGTRAVSPKSTVQPVLSKRAVASGPVRSNQKNGAEID